MVSNTEKDIKKSRNHIVYGVSYMNSAAMQIMGRQNVYAEFFRQLKERDCFPAKESEPLNIAEHTIGTGDSSALLVKNLRRLHPKGDINYFAVDHNDIFVEQARARVQKAGASHVNVHTADALNDTAENMQRNMGLSQGQKANILLVEHGFYYVADSQEKLDASMDNILQSLAPDGILISVVSGERSDIGKLRLTYNPNVNEGKVYEMIDSSLKSKGLEPHIITVPAVFPFPKLTPSEWESLAAGKYTFDNCPPNNDRLFHAINLVTFFGRPTEFMHADGTLKPYVERIRRMAESDPQHAVVSDASIQITASHGSAPEFKRQVAEIVENINQRINEIAESSLAAAMDKFHRERVTIHGIGKNQ